jgi:hypothetical protein
MSRFSLEMNKIKRKMYAGSKVTYRIKIYQKMVYINQIDWLDTFFE